MRLVVLVALGACFAPHAPADVPCDPVTPSCPSDQRCIARADGFRCEPLGTLPDGDGGIDAPPVGDGSPGDQDGDGIPDELDNCPTVANTDQANEDGDAFGDACDPCPPIADANPPADADGDGVSDACDPNPHTPGDHIVRFDGFHGSTLPVGWTASGSWKVDGDALVGATQGVGFATLSIPAPGGHDTIRAAFHVTRIDTGADRRSVAVIDDSNVATSSGIGCEVATESDNTTFAGIVDLGPGTQLASQPHGFAVGDQGQLNSRRDGLSFVCALTEANANDTFGASYDMDNLPAAIIGVRLHGADATFDWVIVIAN